MGSGCHAAYTEDHGSRASTQQTHHGSRMKSNFQGQLEEGVLVNLLQYLALNSASGVLQLREASGTSAALYFHQGQLVHAVNGELEGPTALAPLLGWHAGRFSFHAGTPSPKRSIHTSLDSLLLKAAFEADITVDESRSALDERSVLSPRPFTSGTQSVSLSLRSLHLLRQFDGQLTLGQIGERLQLPLADVIKAAEELVKQDLVEVKDAAAAPTAFIDAVTRLARDIMGPVADIVVEDTLYELGFAPDRLPQPAVPEFLGALARQFQREDWRRAFEVKAAKLCAQYDLD